jgi:serine/threonine-protein kinase
MSDPLVELQAELRSSASPLTGDVARDGHPKNRVGRYELVQKLGAGRTGNVYRARHWAFEQEVIIKVLSRTVQEDPDRLEHFQKEARRAARIQHANLINAIDIGRSPTGHYYFVMEYIAGQSLAEILHCVNIFEERRAIEIILQIARAIEHIHSREMVHGEVCPENIYLARNQMAKLCGVGLARKIVDWPDELSHTSMSAIHYRSPEAADSEPQDIRADIFSLGATLYHLVTGQAPFANAGTNDIRSRWAKDTLPHPQQLNPSLSDAICRVIARMLARNPEDRYTSPRELLDDLELLKEGSPTRSGLLAPGKSCVHHLPIEALPAQVSSRKLRDHFRWTLRWQRGRNGNRGEPDDPGREFVRSVPRSLALGLLAGFLLVTVALGCYYYLLGPHTPVKQHPHPSSAAHPVSVEK